jgi:hypothetical protein
MELIFLPPRSWNYTKNNSEENIYKFLTFRYLEKNEVKFEILDPYTKPLNPFSNGNPFICGLDFVRALRVLLFRRNVDAVISIFESSGLFILLLRNFFFINLK